jgi:hypothetical protein
MNEKKKQQQQPDAGTIADRIWERWQRDGRPPVHSKLMLEYQNNARIKNW